MKKLKQQYRSHIKAHGTYLWDVYPSVRSGTHKHFSTKQEKSYFSYTKLSVVDIQSNCEQLEGKH
ncbi:hypothetical protein [Vibrio coralliilyticus]|uniref:hypothetical protein n=1 Tax=Vibrio coralliilyticus TaxID=190893 RepID=UPI001F34700B|nr:hypothetical protein [Vibrio coralliilyticus]